MAIDPITGKEKKEKLSAVNPAINEMARKTLGGVVDPYADGSVLRKAQDKQPNPLQDAANIAENYLGGAGARKIGNVAATPIRVLGVDRANQTRALTPNDQLPVQSMVPSSLNPSRGILSSLSSPQYLPGSSGVLQRMIPDAIPKMAPAPLASTPQNAPTGEGLWTRSNADGTSGGYTTPREQLLGRPDVQSPTKTLYSNPGGRMVANDVPITRPTANTAREGGSSARDSILGRPQRIGNLDVTFDGMPGDERARFTESANLEARRTLANPKPSMIASTQGGLMPLMNSGPSTPASAQSFGDLFVQGLQSKRDRAYAGINDANEKNRIALLGQNQQLGIAGMNDATSRRAQDMTAADAAVRNGIQATTAASNAAHATAQIEGLTTDAAAKRQVMGDANSLNIERQRLAGLTGDARAIQEQKIADLTGQKSEPFKIADTSSIDPITQLPIKNAYMVDAKGNIKKIGDDQQHEPAPVDPKKRKVGQTYTANGKVGVWNGKTWDIVQ